MFFVFVVFKEVLYNLVIGSCFYFVELGDCFVVFLNIVFVEMMDGCVFVGCVDVDVVCK